MVTEKPLVLLKYGEGVRSRLLTWALDVTQHYSRTNIDINKYSLLTSEVEMVGSRSSTDPAPQSEGGLGSLAGSQVSHAHH